MASGLGELTFTSTISGVISMSNFTVGGRVTVLAGNSYLLYIILVVCTIVLVLLLAGVVLLCVLLCQKTKKRAKRSPPERTAVVSKATSVTDLNSNCYPGTYAQLQAGLEDGDRAVQHDAFNKLPSKPIKVCSKPSTRAMVQLQQQLITSTPTVKTETVIACNDSRPLLAYSQSPICSNDSQNSNNSKSYPKTPGLFVNNNLSDAENHLGQKGNVVQDGEWTTGDLSHMSPTDEKSSPSELYGTACTHVEADSSSSDKLLPTSSDLYSSEQEESQGLISPSDCLFSGSLSYDENQSPTSITTSLPLDAYGHPRAWFVPLDEMYREPLRHSFIDVSNHDLKEFKDNSKASPGRCLASGSEKHKKTCSPQKLANPVEHNADAAVFADVNEDYSFTWRDSGIPTSCSNIRNSNSSESNGNKQSAWEQRECRPVLFLDKQSDVVAMTNLDSQS